MIKSTKDIVQMSGALQQMCSQVLAEIMLRKENNYTARIRERGDKIMVVSYLMTLCVFVLQLKKVIKRLSCVCMSALCAAPL